MTVLAQIVATPGHHLHLRKSVHVELQHERRRRFSEQFKAETVALIRNSGKSGFGPGRKRGEALAGTGYLAVILDALSRRVVGWALADHLRTELASDALQMALVLGLEHVVGGQAVYPRPWSRA